MEPTTTETVTNIPRDAPNAALQIILDYTELADPARRPDFVAALRKAMVGLGFFYLRDSPLQQGKQELFALAKAFFDKPVEERMKIAQEKSRHFRECTEAVYAATDSRWQCSGPNLTAHRFVTLHAGGWSEIGTERTLGRTDNREQIDFGIESPELPPSFRTPAYLNLWGPK